MRDFFTGSFACVFKKHTNANQIGFIKKATILIHSYLTLISLSHVERDAKRKSSYEKMDHLYIVIALGVRLPAGSDRK